MSREVNGALLKHLFQLAEQDRQDEKLEKLLDEVIDKVQYSPKSIKIDFKNGIIVLISWNFDSYQMYISDHSFYDGGDTPFSPLGGDRVLYYLKNIAQFKYDWRKNGVH